MNIENEKALIQLGNNVAKYRKKKGITQLRLALLAGTTQSYICDVELGRRNIAAVMLLKIAEALDVTVGDLFEGVTLK